ncbi:hypothetical protein F5Y11DRAFT_317697 [Daldinia sp. FL1419]|nr:hypothetical protein F5Y11DRAFT_317697 [Daldinia sp. FL1419]
MANHASNAPWSGNQDVDEYGLQVKPMGLKVQYTFDKDCQERCLARWPHVLQVQTIPMDEHNRIGVVDLRPCLQAVAQCSPELIGSAEKDYTVYAYDYSEPDVPLVGQGMLSWGIDQGPNSTNAPQLVTGRITKNLLAAFGTGIRETLEVRLKLTPVPKIARNNPTQTTTIEPITVPRISTPTPSENTEWNSFTQSHSNLAQPQGAPISSMVPTPIQPFYPNHEARVNTPMSSFQGPISAPGSRPASVEPSIREPRGPPSIQESAPQKQGMPMDELAIVPIQAKGSKPQSRPASRASSRPPSGRPRGRPRKKPLPAEGSTSGYEDGTDADDGPPRSKKRATMTKAERSNTATFGSVPESLRVVASTAGSIRNFRPIASAGDAPTGQEVPRAPTPVPDSRFSGLPHPRPLAPSRLRRESISSSGMDRSFTPSFREPSASMSQSQDARSPVESAGASPSHTYSDEASPDIGSSPPVPRSALYSMRSSPAPSSPVLPPMPVAMPQPDSGYMSGGLDSRIEETNPTQKAPAVAKPKPRRSRAKKPPTNIQNDLIIHTETPGPPELLPQTSIYNPPHLSRKASEVAKAPVVSETPRLPTARAEAEVSEEQRVEKEALPEKRSTQENVSNLELTHMDSFVECQTQRPLSASDGHSITQAPESLPRYDNAQITTELVDGRMEPPILQQTQDTHQEPEPELPAVPASDPVLPQLTFPTLHSEPAHPQTDAIGPTDGKSNKNFVKRQTIRQKLEEAVAQGQLPSFCRNCGALQTPTWRKIWKQEHKGIPAYHEYSEKPGYVTAINVLERDTEGKVTLYEIIKKSLGPKDSKSAWNEVLLCNPCGIWFSKFKQHRPAEKWEKDEQRLSQTRKKRANGNTQPRSKKARTKSDSQPSLTSEACPPTDPLGPLDGPPSPKNLAESLKQTQQQGLGMNLGQGCEKSDLEPTCRGSTHSRGSTRSRGSGTPGSPIAIDDDLGVTRRLLFPSPRKDGEQRILGEADINIMQTSPEYPNTRGGHELEKENSGLGEEDLADIFGTPPRPSTPPPKASHSGPFKTPTRPTPSHRPVTRSVTRSMRSGRSVNSPSQILMAQRTPTRTPRSSAAKRHSPGSLLPSHLLDSQIFDTPLSRSIHQLIPDLEQFNMPIPSSPGFQLDLSSLAPLDGGDLTHASLDFGNLFGLDVAQRSSPSARNEDQGRNFGQHITYDKHTGGWADMDAEY